MKRKKRGIRIKTLGIVMSFIIVVLSVSSMIANISLNRTYIDVQDSLVKYEKAKDLAQRFSLISDELTTATILYVGTGRVQYLNQYFDIVEKQKREEVLHELDGLQIEHRLLDQALDASIALEEMEMHSFALKAYADGDLDQMPEKIKNYNLTKEERTKPSEELSRLAMYYMVGELYDAHKQELKECVDGFYDKMVQQADNARIESMSDMNRNILLQQILLGSMIALIILLAIVLYAQIGKILYQYVENIATLQPLEPKGVYELRYLADIYNDLRSIREEEKKVLQEKATLDALSGLPNRGTFEQFMRNRMDSPRIVGALAIVDVDKFKKINDTYGHAIGDEAIREVAELLNSSFRANDFLGRFGGDEFVVWIESVTPEKSSYIKMRIEEINNKLKQPESDEIPKMSLSVGVTFYQQGDDYEQMFKRADDALYVVKNHGRCGCQFYEEM